MCCLCLVACGTEHTYLQNEESARALPHRAHKVRIPSSARHLNWCSGNSESETMWQAGGRDGSEPGTRRG